MNAQVNVKHVVLLSIHLLSPPIPNLLPWFQPMGQSVGWQAAMVGVKQVHRCWLGGGWDVCGVMVWNGVGEDNGELIC